jgi:pimeloyl-ACP methyl ester carboxylesterase
MEYRLAGEGPTVLVSHGVNGGLDHGMRLTKSGSVAVLGAGYRFLYVSRFGYLRSALPKQATARLQAAAYQELLDHLGIDQVYLFGNSAGGPSTMWFAIDYPERTSSSGSTASQPRPRPGANLATALGIRAASAALEARMAVASRSPATSRVGQGR